MSTENTPKLIILKTGELFKIYQVTGLAGMKMPLHYSNKEAVVIFQKGYTQLKIDEIKYTHQEGSTFIIPAHQNHTHSVKAKFKAFIIISQYSNIECVN